MKYLFVLLILLSLACGVSAQLPGGKLPPTGTVYPSTSEAVNYTVTADVLRVRVYPSLDAEETGEYLYLGDVVTCADAVTVQQVYNGEIVSISWCNIGTGWVSMDWMKGINP